MNQEPKYPVQTLGKAIEILEYLAKDKTNRGVGVTEISKELSMGKSSVHRTLDTLLHYGYVAKIEETSRYRLGWGLYTIGQKVPKQNHIFNINSEYLEKLNEITDETVNLGIRDRSETMIISKIQGNLRGVSFGIDQGDRESLYATSIGKMLLSEMDEDDVRELLKDTEFVKYTANTIDNIEVLIEDLRMVKQLGYAMDDEEFAMGMICLSKPVRDYTGEIVAAISVSSPAFKLTLDKKTMILEALSECCGSISENLGYRR